MISIQQALDAIDRCVQPLGVETVGLASAVGRRLASPLISDVDSPPHDKSLMDGFAVRAQDLTQPDTRFTIVETIRAGDIPCQNIGTNQAARIMTGAPIPMGADSVVMRERVSAEGETNGLKWVQFEAEHLPPGHHVLPRGASMTKGELVLPAGHVVRPVDVAVMAEIGCAKANVYQTPSVAILATGNELVACQELPGPGQIRNSNGPMLCCLASRHVSHIADLGIATDDYQDLKGRCGAGLENDLLVISGGVSEGIADLVPHVLTDLGVRCEFHKVSIKPGKPIWFGTRQHQGRTQYVFGLPGNPLSALICFRLFVTACINKLSGGQASWPTMNPARLTIPHSVRGPRPTFWPVSADVGKDAVCQITPLIWQGSSDVRCLAEADGWGYFPPAEDPYAAGTSVPYLPIENRC